MKKFPTIGQKCKYGEMIGVIKLIYKENKKTKISCNFESEGKTFTVNFFLQTMIMDLVTEHSDHYKLELL